MKHAIMIMAHGNFNHLIHMVEYFNHDCYVFIHIDLKSSISDKEMETLKKIPQVISVHKKYKIQWGGFSILKCEIFLLKEALTLCDADYFHLISGQDYPVRPLNCFLKFFEQKRGFDFIQYVHLPHPQWENNTFARFQYFYMYDFLHGNRKKVNQWVDFQKKHSIKRAIPNKFDHIYGNSQWFSITYESAKLLIEYTNSHTSFYRRMRMTFAPEEAYISTVLVNLKNKKYIFSNNFRFILWKFVNGNMPANLDSSHFFFLLRKEYIFARKFDTNISLSLTNLIDKYLINDNQKLTFKQTGGWEYNGFLKYDYDELFTQALIQCTKHFQINSVIDMGCGCGLYVSELRRKGIAIAGYDANPYTEELSRLLLPPGDSPCEQADLTEDLDVTEPFELVICKDVIHYIPEHLINKALSNLTKLSSKYILISWSTYNANSEDNIHTYQEKEILNYFLSHGFVVIKDYTLFLREIIKDHNYKKYNLLIKNS